MATKTDVAAEDYKEKYGFSDPIDSYAVKGIKGLSERVVQEISRMHDEPAWMEQTRMKALKHFLERKAPAWAPELSEIDYQSFYYYASPTRKAADSWDQLPDYIKRTYDKLGITEAEKKFLAGVGAIYECLSGDSKIFTTRGLKPISEVDPGDIVFSWDQHSERIVPAPVKSKSFKGRRPVFEVKTENDSILATENHPFLILTHVLSRGHARRGFWVKEWRYLSEIRAGDIVVVPKAIPIAGQPYKLVKPEVYATTTGHNQFGTAYVLNISYLYNEVSLPEKSTPELMWFLGLYMGDEYVHSSTRESGKIRARVEFSITTREPELRNELVSVGKKLFGLSATSTDDLVSFNSTILANFLYSNGFRTGAKAKSIPNWVFTLPRDQILSFLAGVIDSDGYAAPGKFLNITGCNSKLMGQLRDLCRFCGFPVSRMFSFKGHDKNGETTNYRFYIYGRFEEIPCRNPQRTSRFWRRKYVHTRGGTKQRKLGKYLNADIGITRITSIRPVGSDNVYDIEINGPHNFIAEGFIVHNSEAVYHSIQGELAKQGVVFTDTVTAMKEYPDVMKKYFGTVVPYQDNYIAALQTAVWSAGSFVYVPSGVKVTTPLQAYFRINERNMGQFERTLIIAEPHSEVTYIEGCLPADELVSEGSTMKPILLVDKNQGVVAESGRMEKVTKKFVHLHKGEMITIVPLSHGNAFRLTPEHPVLTIKRSEVKATRKTRNGWLPEVSTGKLMKATPRYVEAGRLKVGDFLVYVAPQETIDNPALTDTMLKILGFYLAEGSITYNRSLRRQVARFSFGGTAAEESLARELVSLIKLTGEKASMHKSRGLYYSVSTYSKSLIGLLLSHCGTGASTKMLSGAIMELPAEKQMLFLKYYLRGDGNRYLKNGGSMMVRVSTASSMLAFQIQELLARSGIFANLSIRRGSRDTVLGREVDRKDQYIIEYTEGKKWSEVRRVGNHFFVPIKRIHAEVYNDLVYNLEVERENSYLVKGFAVHNCTAPVYSSQSLHSAIVEIVAQKGSLVKYTTLQNWSRDVLNLVTKRAHAHEEATVSWVDFNGGCLVKGTNVLTNNDVKHIEDLEVGSRVYSLNGELELVSSEVAARRVNPPSEVYRLTTLNHREIEATPNHPFLSLRKNNGLLSLAWTPLSALKVGDLVAVSGEMPDRGKPYEIEFAYAKRIKKKMLVPTQTTDDLLWLLGFYVGDGTSEGARVSFCLTESDPAYGRIVSVLKSLFGLEGKQHTSNKAMFRVNSKDFANFIKALGFAGGAKTKEVPAWVFRLPNSQKRAFVKGYIAADGCIRKGHRNVSISSTNLALLRQVKVLAISAGLSPLKISKWTQHAKFPNGTEGTYTNYYLYFSDKKVRDPLYFVPLTKVEPVGQKVTYDIEVAGTGNFVANGMIVHNSRLTRKYPSIYLLGPRSKADIISVAYAGAGQVQDTGGKAIHLARDTTSRIISRSVSKDGGHTAYRGLLHIAKGASNVKSTVRCVKPSTIILGDNKPIVEYAPGDHAIGVSGANTVARTYLNEFSGQMVKIIAAGLMPIEVTPEHPMLISRSRLEYPLVQRNGRHAHTMKIQLGSPRWEPASRLVAKNSHTDGDYLLIPKIKGNIDTRLLDVAQFAKNTHGLHTTIGKGRASTLPLDADTAWAIGMYVAEGYSSQDKLKFALNSAETDIRDRLMTIFGKLGYKVRSYKAKNEEGAEVVVFGSLLPRAFAEWCGAGAPNKRIPDFILLHKDMDIVNSFLNGYISGDGTVTINSVGERNVVHIVTTSKLLAMQIQLIGARKNLFFRVTRASIADEVQGRKVRAHEKYDVRCSLGSNVQARFDEKFMYVPIRRIDKTKYEGPVYNLETSDHTYLVSNAVSHNCDALLIDERSTTATYPYMEIQEDDATVTHEASVGKVGEEQLFYLMSRGISERDALSMVVNGFLEPFAKELPMAYAVEFNRLMSLEMTNTVG